MNEKKNKQPRKTSSECQLDQTTLKTTSDRRFRNFSDAPLVLENRRARNRRSKSLLVPGHHCPWLEVDTKLRICKERGFLYSRLHTQHKTGSCTTIPPKPWPKSPQVRRLLGYGLGAGDAKSSECSPPVSVADGRQTNI